MACSVREERWSLATSLRDDLAEAKRVILLLHPDNVEPFLQLWAASTNAGHSWRPAVSNQFRNRARAADSSTKRAFVKQLTDFGTSPC